MKISSELMDELIAHALEEAPNECCGVVAVELDASGGGAGAVASGGASAALSSGEASAVASGRAGAALSSGGASVALASRAAKVHRAENVAASPLKFEVDGKELLGLIDAIDVDGQELGAIYHSHTRTEPKPSQTDINFAANWPGVEWIILGLADGQAPEVRSYLIEEGRVREVALEVG